MFRWAAISRESDRVCHGHADRSAAAPCPGHRRAPVQRAEPAPGCWPPSGLVACAALAGVLIWVGQPVLAVVAGAFAVVAVVDLVVIQLRRRQRRRTDPERHSLFE